MIFVVVAVSALLVGVLSAPVAGWLTAVLAVPLFLVQWVSMAMWVRSANTRRLWQKVARDQQNDASDQALYNRVMKHFRIPADPKANTYAPAVSTMLRSYWLANGRRKKEGLPLLWDHTLIWGYRRYARAIVGDGFDPMATAVITAWSTPKVAVMVGRDKRHVSDSVEGSIGQKDFDAAREGRRLSGPEVAEALGLHDVHLIDPSGDAGPPARPSGGQGALH